MPSDIALQMIDWQGGGYFAYPDPPPQALALSQEQLSRDPPLLWTVALSSAKRGDFALAPTLIELCRDDSNPILNKLSSELLGDVGSDASIGSVVERLTQGGDNYEVTLEFCSVLHARGMLRDVVTMLDAFERIQEIEDADIIPTYISDCLEDDYGPLSDHLRFASFPKYRQAVESRFQQLADGFGTDRILVLKGRPFVIRSLGERILDRVRLPYFPMFLRRRFEASTGINCTSFYVDRVLQPLSASALVETFLESPEAAKYQNGVRYFFGHRIPD